MLWIGTLLIGSCITIKQVPITSGYVLQGNNVNYTKIHVWVPWSASSVLAKKIEPAL